ncbi:transmembrane protein 135 [Trichonephila clavipes]|nr:transmembrane protein 135 [Trichonephila clavipes]
MIRHGRCRFSASGKSTDLGRSRTHHAGYRRPIEITFQNLCLLGVKKGTLPQIYGSSILLYAVLTGVIYHAVIMEPHCLRPSYFKFCAKVSHNKIGQINRLALDTFGSQASKLFSDVHKFDLH